MLENETKYHFLCQSKKTNPKISVCFVYKPLNGWWLLQTTVYYFARRENTLRIKQLFRPRHQVCEWSAFKIKTAIRPFVCLLFQVTVSSFSKGNWKVDCLRYNVFFLLFCASNIFRATTTLQPAQPQEPPYSYLQPLASQAIITRCDWHVRVVCILLMRSLEPWSLWSFGDRWYVTPQKSQGGQSQIHFKYSVIFFTKGKLT